MAFTVQQLFNRVIGMLGIEAANATTYLASFPQQTNVVITDCFKIENTNRVWKKLVELTTIPTVTALVDSIDYQEELMQILANGLAMFLSLSDDETIKTQFYNSQYEESKAKANKMNPKAIVDYFSAEDVTL